MNLSIFFLETVSELSIKRLIATQIQELIYLSNYLSVFEFSIKRLVAPRIHELTDVTIVVYLILLQKMGRLQQRLSFNSPMLRLGTLLSNIESLGYKDRQDLLPSFQMEISTTTLPNHPLSACLRETVEAKVYFNFKYDSWDPKIQTV